MALAKQTPVALAIAGVVALIGAKLIPQMLEGNTRPQFVQHVSECQADRSTLRHTGGKAAGAGSYTPCLIDTGMRSGEPGLAITKDGILLRSVTTGPAGIAVSSDNGKTWVRRVLPKDTRTGIPDGYHRSGHAALFLFGTRRKPGLCQRRSGQDVATRHVRFARSL